MKAHAFFVLLFATLFIIGCSSKEPVQRAIYDGLTTRETITDPSSKPIPQEYPSYDEYRLEREKILQQEK